MNEYQYPANRICYINSSDYGTSWTENRSPTGKEFKYNGEMYFGSNSLDLELGRTSDYVACDSSSVKLFIFSTSDRGWHWSEIRTIKSENEKEHYGTVELSTRDSVMAVLSCMDNRVWLEYSTDWGKTFTEPMLLSHTYVNHLGDVGGTGDPRLAIDKYYRIHAAWSQTVDSSEVLKAMFYYMQSTSGVAETPVEESGPFVLASPNPFADRIYLEMILDKDEPFSLAVYDASGRMIRNLGTGGKGFSRLYRDGSDERGGIAPQGLYFIHARRDTRVELIKVIKLK